MSGQQIGTVVGGVAGGVIGFFAGGNVYAGVQIGMGVGGLIGGAIDPTKMYGPHVGDGQAQSATDGSPISWVMGTMWVAGTICDVGKRQEFPVKQQGGKGSGTEQYSYEAHQNFSIIVCESDAIKGSTISQVLMVEQDGKIVYDVRPGSTMLADSAKWLARNCIFYYGDEAQLPTAADEAAHGVGNAPAYRAVLRAFFTQFNVTAVGDRIPSFRFLVTSSALTPVGFGGGQAYPNVSTVATPSAPGSYTLQFAMGNVPDKCQVYAGSTLLLDTGYWGDPAQQSALNSALASYGAGPEPIHDSGARPPLNANDEFADPTKRKSMAFTKPAGITTLTVKMWSPIAGTLWNYAIVAPGADTPIADIVGAIVQRGGLTLGQFDVGNLAGLKTGGYAIAKQMNAVNALGPLLGAYFAYGSEYDGKIHFDLYGKDAVMTIDEDDLLEANDANGNAVTANLRNNATEFPRRITGRYYDPAQNYMPVTVMQTRRAGGVTATGDMGLDIPVVMDADGAQQTVDKALKVAYAQLEGTLEFSVPFAGPVNVYLSLVAGDAVLFRGKRWIVTNPILSDGYIKLTLQYDRQSAYTSNVQAIPGLTPTPPASRYSGPTTLIPMNLPALQSSDGYGLYLAAGPVDPTTQNWRGCNVQMSLDSGATWQTVTQINAPSVYGALTAADTGTTLVAQVNGDLESVGSAQLDAQQNAAALLHGTQAEVLQFGTATEDPTTTDLYTLTDMRRHLLGTTQISGAIGDRFVMLDNVVLLPIDIAFAGKTIQLRGVGYGEDADSATVVSIVYNPDTTIIYDGGQVT